MPSVKIPAILVRDKWDTYVVRADDGTIASAALEIVAKRVKDGFWYDNWDERAWADEAAAIVERGDGDAALHLLRDRRDFEYEWIEETSV